VNSRERRTLKRMLKEAGVEHRSVSNPSREPVAPAIPVHHFVTLRKIPGWLWVTIGAGAVLITFLQAYPWLSIEGSERLDERNELSQLFQVVNDGYIPITHLDADCESDFALRGGFTAQNVRFAQRDFTDYLGHNGSATVPCFRLLTLNGDWELSEGTTLRVTVSYSFYKLNFGHYLRHSQSFGFKAIRGPNGRSHWQYLG
jgi:hypothetical protein